ncbi:MAG: hypothetical protein AAB276_06280, partial [Pseudomonadota bacterium]
KYLPDVAKIEWAHFTASFAPDMMAINFEWLSQQISNDPDFILNLHPSVCVIEQNINAIDIWQGHQSEPVHDIEIVQKTHRILIWRDQDNLVKIETVSYPLYAFIQHIQQHVGFAASLSKVYEIPDVDILAFQKEFSGMVTMGLFARLENQ